MKFTQRPLPINAKSIGTFIYFLDLMSYMAIINNAGLLTVTNTYFFSDFNFMQIFIIIFVVLYFTRTIMELIYGDVDYDTMQILKRMQFISERSALGFTRNKPSGTTEPSLPIYKPFGTLVEDFEQAPEKKEEGEKI